MVTRQAELVYLPREIPESNLEASMKTMLLSCVSGIFLFAVLNAMVVSQELTQAQFSQLHSELDPKSETWKTIPWHSDLLSGQRAAVAQKKLIFIWSMDGHPLGCT